MSSTMKRWQMSGIGKDKLGLAEVPVPTPGPGELLVKVAAVSLNYRDKLMTETGMGLPLQFPFTPASDLAGTVVAVGAGATRFKAGDRVISTFTPGWIDGKPPGDARVPPYRSLGGFHPGVLAEFVAFPEDWFVAAPASLNDAEASTLPCAGLTAWFALVERGPVAAGETVLVQGTGGVALFGLQLAKAHGAEVIVTSSSDEKLAGAKALGADHGINRAKEDWVEALYRLTKDRGADHILEIAGGPGLGRSLAAVAVHGRISVIGVLEGFDISGPAGPLLLKSPIVQGISVGHRRALEDLVAAVDRIGLKPVIDRSYALADLPAALDHLDRGAFGKIVVDVG
ncbi:zinc-dependent alcohol dehydrogenase family protein [Methylovirgula sp. 4M-Z18]|uniref:zinc-dependent alcohol dehydrogenase family protein n=1 Tax=Methylovirgula sp. 4M-Z18 TaxID=2293567 RepID=UPI000E2E9E22|nr:NAD(P)-dependent alcohol dehydrogenase [Methylovirgula sp. 4M-Z18]RFB75581.1 NAD(P)-dependent alcohol dehydrogenase [Methylovirgula sp. 4M-Z18]